MESLIHSHYALEEHRRTIDDINRSSWKFRKIKKSYEKQFCFKFIRKWCITVSYS